MAHVPDWHYNTISQKEMMDSFQTAYEHFVNAPKGLLRLVLHGPFCLQLRLHAGAVLRTGGVKRAVMIHHADGIVAQRRQGVDVPGFGPKRLLHLRGQMRVKRPTP